MKFQELVLKNFKSYKDVAITDLNPGINIVLGRNGHGKSNVHLGKSNFA